MTTTGMAVEAELVFRLAAVEESRRRDHARINLLAEAADISRFAEMARRQRLLGILGSRLVETVPDTPAWLADAVEHETSLGRQRVTLLGHMTHHLSEVLERSSIRAVPLKGASLAERIYADPGVRGPSADLDFLVAPEQLDASVSTLEEIGYRIHDPTKWADGLPHYHYGLNPPTPAMPKVELHWRVHWYEKRFAAEALARAAEAPGAGWVLAPADELATLLFICTRDGFLGLRLATDVAAWWDVYGHSLPAAVLDPILESHRELRQALLAGLEIARSWTGLPSERLCSPRWRLSRRAAIATRLSNWDISGEPKDVATGITLIDLLLTPRGAYRVFLRHYYFQPLGHYQAVYGWSAGQKLRNRLRGLAHAYGRLMRSAGQYASRLWRLGSR